MGSFYIRAFFLEKGEREAAVQPSARSERKTAFFAHFRLYGTKGPALQTENAPGRKETACWGRQAVTSGEKCQQRKEGVMNEAKVMPYSIFYLIL